MYVSPSGAGHAPFRQARPPSTILEIQSMGSRPDGTSGGGVSLPPAKPHQTMSVLARPRPVVEISLLRQSVGALAERRTTCDHCRRTPLVGERVYLYAAAAGERLVCELCRH